MSDLYAKLEVEVYTWPVEISTADDDKISEAFAEAAELVKKRLGETDFVREIRSDY